MDTLFLITARGGSKGIPGKNIKVLGNTPLIHYSIDIARQFVSDDFICVSTDSEEIAKCAESKGLHIPFLRPADLASDTAGSYEVLLHALDFYSQKKEIEKIVLLQPTSPLRLKAHVKGCIDSFSISSDAVYSVKLTKSNPFQLLYTEDENGYLRKVIEGNAAMRRQDMPPVFELNGAVYVYNAESLRNSHPREFKKIKYFEMPELNSVDIDTYADWEWASYLLEKKLVQFDYE